MICLPFQFLYKSLYKFIDNDQQYQTGQETAADLLL